MASVGPEAQEAALPYRVYGLEGIAKTHDAAIEKLQQNDARRGEALGAQAVTLARHEELLGGAHEDIVEVKTDVSALAVAVAGLAEKVASVGSRVAWVLVTCTLTVVAALIVFIVTSQPPT